MSQESMFSKMAGACCGLGLGAVLLGWSGWVPETRAFWWLSRSAGIVAYALLWLNIVSGLLLSGRWLRERLAPALVAQLHQTLSGLALGFILFHGAILLGDRYLAMNMTDLLLPFHTSFHPLWMAAGQLSLGLVSAVLLTTHLRRHLGSGAWRAVHLTAYAAYWLSLAHAVALGSESGDLYMAYVASGASVLWLTTTRILTRASSPARPGERLRGR